MDKVDIDYILREAVKLPKSLKSVLDEQSMFDMTAPSRLDDTEKLYTEESIAPPRVPKPKKRKTDIRTLRRKKLEYTKKHRREKADHYREAEGSLRNQFFKIRREMLRRARGDAREGSNTCWDWELTLEEWINLWLSCPLVDLGNGLMVTANSLRGRKYKENVQLKRIDPSKPFRINNLVVMLGRRVLYVP